MWKINSVTNIGKRKKNQDFIISKQIQKDYRIIDIHVLCDGIGQFSQSGLCAKYAAEGIVNLIQIYFGKRKSKGKLDKTDLIELEKIIKQRLSIKNINEVAGTTMVATIIDRNIENGKINFIYLWSGDSRLYFKETNCKLVQLTNDHVEKGEINKPITSSINERGQIIGNLEGGFVSTENFQYVALTSDGIHDRCSRNELQDFLDYISNFIKPRNKRVEEDLLHFLYHNKSDNLSLILQQLKS